MTLLQKGDKPDLSCWVSLDGNDWNEGLIRHQEIFEDLEIQDHPRVIHCKVSWLPLEGMILIALQEVMILGQMTDVNIANA